MAVARFGEAALFTTGFLIIPFDLFTRDLLHEHWHGKALLPKMAALIASGSLLTFALNSETLPVAVGSLCAFAAAGLTNTFFYELLWRQPKMIKMNTSNLFAAIVDSAVFVSIVFGPALWTMGTQSAIKFFGGLFWTLIYLRYGFKRTAKAH